MRFRNLGFLALMLSSSACGVPEPTALSEKTASDDRATILLEGDEEQALAEQIGTSEHELSSYPQWASSFQGTIFYTGGVGTWSLAVFPSAASYIVLEAGLCAPRVTGASVFATFTNIQLPVHFVGQQYYAGFYRAVYRIDPAFWTPFGWQPGYQPIVSGAVFGLAGNIACPISVYTIAVF